MKNFMMVAALCLIGVVPFAAVSQSAPALTILDVDEPTENVTFDGPLSSVEPAVDGKSMSDLILGEPLFPPIEGLPDAAWKERDCSGCHAWTPESLCEYATGFYLGDDADSHLSKPHPYGGTFKANMRVWAQGGCK